MFLSILKGIWPINALKIYIRENESFTLGSFHLNKPKMAYSRDPFLETTERDWRERLERERETSKIQEMDLWQMA